MLVGLSCKLKEDQDNRAFSLTRPAAEKQSSTPRGSAWYTKMAAAAAVSLSFA